MKEFLNNMMKLVVVLLIVTVAVGVTFYMLKLKNGVGNERAAVTDSKQARKQQGSKDQYIQSIALRLGNNEGVRDFNNSGRIVGMVKSASDSKRTIVFMNKDLKYYNAVTGLRIKAGDGYNLSVVQNAKFTQGNPNLLPLNEPLIAKSQNGLLRLTGSFAYNNTAFESGKMIYLGQLIVDDGKGIKDKLDLVLDGRTRN